MKCRKKIGFFTLLYALIIMSQSGSIWSEETLPATSEDNRAVILDPQQQRIAALITRLTPTQAHEIETLQANGTGFLGLLRESTTGDPQGCILLLHGNNEHPDWPEVIHPIRTQLNDNSWCTVAIEIPDMTKRFELADLDPSTESPTEVELVNQADVFARIDATRQFIREKGYSPTVLLGHGTGSAYALQYAATQGNNARALMLIDTQSVPPLDDYAIAQLIRQIRLPILDYYFANHTQQIEAADFRQAAANKRGGTKDVYIQIRAMPDRRYDPVADKRLTQRIWGFLKQNTTQIQQTRPLPQIDKGLFHETDN
jgi:pimeloyl-ACP methyl ester carboxylesterase